MRAFHVGRIAAAASLAIALSACASLPVIPVQGLERDLEPLAGEWTGRYEGDGVDRRSGNILFILTAGEDHAHGDVLMTSSSRRRVGPEPSRGSQDDPFGETQYLAIRFVRVDRARVSGAMDPYWDPDRGCWAQTIFEGRLAGDAISGRFRTQFSLPLRAVEGAWSVTRRAPAGK
jgi:hypothetical protein